jgi:hypothetical protein
MIPDQLLKHKVYIMINLRKILNENHFQIFRD